VKDVGDGPELLEYVQEVEYEGHALEGGADPALECPLAVGDHHPGAPVQWVAPHRLGPDIGDEGVFARE
jgi:hypothetical protein